LATPQAKEVDMAGPRLDRLEAVMMIFLPVDGSKVPNGQLRLKWVQAAITKALMCLGCAN
jgi:hypothetical protein